MNKILIWVLTYPTWSILRHLILFIVVAIVNGVPKVTRHITCSITFFFHMSDQVLALLFFQLRRGWLLPPPPQRRIGASVAAGTAMVAPCGWRRRHLQPGGPGGQWKMMNSKLWKMDRELLLLGRRDLIMVKSAMHCNNLHSHTH